MSQSNYSSSKVPGTTSVTLLKRALKGEDAAWQRLVSLYSPLVYTKCRRVGLSRTDAADVVQEVFSSVFLALPKFRRDHAEHGFRRWLHRIARNAAIDVIRRQQRQVSAEGGSQGQARLQAVSDPFSDDAAFSQHDPDIALVVHSALALFRADYEPSTWQAFWQTAVEEMPAVDVARSLGLSPGAVRQAKYRILRRLRDEFSDLDLNRPDTSGPGQSPS